MLVFLILENSSSIVSTPIVWSAKDCHALVIVFNTVALFHGFMRADDTLEIVELKKFRGDVGSKGEYPTAAWAKTKA
jgi:hypothetical protein